VIYLTYELDIVLFSIIVIQLLFKFKHTTAKLLQKAMTVTVLEYH